MFRKIALAGVIAAFLIVLTPSESNAWRGFHYGYAHYGYYGAYHVGPAYYHPYVYHPYGYGAYGYGYRYGAPVVYRGGVYRRW